MAKKTKTVVAPDGQGMFFRAPDLFREDLWDTYGDYLAGHGRELDKQQKALEEKCGWLMWDVGDWLLEGEEGGLSMKQLRRRAETKFAGRNRTWKTMRNWKATAKAFRHIDGEPSRRRDGREGRKVLPYSIHQLVEQYEPEIQDRLLELAAEGSLEKNPNFPRDPKAHVLRRVPFTVDKFKAVIRSMKASGDLPQAGKVTPGASLKSLSISVSARLYSFLCDLSHVRFYNKSPKRMLHWMLDQYLREHQAELDAELAAFYKQTPEERDAHWDRVNEQLGEVSGCANL